MGMLMRRHIRQNEIVLENANEKAQKPVEQAEEPKAEDSTVTERKVVKTTKKPVKRATGRRTSK